MDPLTEAKPIEGSDIKVPTVCKVQDNVVHEQESQIDYHHPLENPEFNIELMEMNEAE